MWKEVIRYVSQWNDRILGLILQHASHLLNSFVLHVPEKLISCCLPKYSVTTLISPVQSEIHGFISHFGSEITRCHIWLQLISHPDYDSARVPAQIKDSLPSPYSGQMMEMWCDLLLCLKHTHTHTHTHTSAIPCGALTQLTMQSSIFCDEDAHTLSQTSEIPRLILYILHDSRSMPWVPVHVITAGFGFEGGIVGNCKSLFAHLSCNQTAWQFWLKWNKKAVWGKKTSVTSFWLSDVLSDGLVTGRIRVVCYSMVNVGVYKVLQKCEATAGDKNEREFHNKQKQTDRTCVKREKKRQ